MPEDAEGSSPGIPALTARMARGDETAFRMFYDCYFNRLLRYLLVLTGGRQAAAQEALQLTLLRVVRYIKPFDSEEYFWCWLTVLARSALVDEERKRTRYFALLERFFQRRQIETSGPNHDVDAQLLALLEKQVAALPVEERGLLERKYFAHETVKTIADQTDSTEKAVESRLVRIRRKLKEAILSQLHDENPDRS